MRKCILVVFLGLILLISSAVEARSIQDIINEKGPDLIDEHGILDLRYQNISSLEGINKIKSPWRAIIIKLGDNSLEKVSGEDFHRFIYVEILDLSNNKIDTFNTVSRKNLQNLTDLILSSNYLGSNKNISIKIPWLSNLENLDLRNNDIDWTNPSNTIRVKCAPKWFQIRK